MSITDGAVKLADAIRSDVEIDFGTHSMRSRFRVAWLVLRGRSVVWGNGYVQLWHRPKQPPAVEAP